MPSPDPRELGGDLVAYAARLTRAARRRVEQPGGVRVLSLLDEMGPSTITGLADADRCAQPTMTGTVNGLIEQGLVSKHPSPHDGRRTEVRLTPEGAAALAGVRRRNGDLVARLIEQHPVHDAQDLATAVAVLRGLFETSPKGDL